MPTTSEIQVLLEKYLADSMTQAEFLRFKVLLLQESRDASLAALVDQVLAERRYNDTPATNRDEAFLRVMQQAAERTAVAPAPVHRVHFMKRWGWAAAAVLLLAAGTYFAWPVAKQPLPTVAQTSNVITPGRNGAVLTLADGKQVVLDSLGNGVIATQGGAQVVLNNGQLAYGAGEGDEAVLNTMSTPRGRQFRLTLPDGTGVWMNAASSITYPTRFSEKERNVTITGEVYFEVAQNAAQPFRVNVNGKEEIEVLGTNFNVHAYDNAGAVKTTLLQGAVRVQAGGRSVVLKPGEQAGKDLQVDKNADLDKVMAWKNNVFNFNDVSLQEAMQQLERWYDIEVVYENGIPDIPFEGKISRNVSLNGLLKMLANADLKFRIEEGRKLVVTSHL